MSTKTTKKRIIIISAISVILLVLLILCIPVKSNLKDGGSVQYKAILWSATNYNTLPYNGVRRVGTEVKILNFTVFDCTTYLKDHENDGTPGKDLSENWGKLSDLWKQSQMI